MVNEHAWGCILGHSKMAEETYLQHTNTFIRSSRISHIMHRQRVRASIPDQAIPRLMAALKYITSIV